MNQFGNVNRSGWRRNIPPWIVSWRDLIGFGVFFVAYLAQEVLPRIAPRAMVLWHPPAHDWQWHLWNLVVGVGLLVAVYWSLWWWRMMHGGNDGGGDDVTPDDPDGPGGVALRARMSVYRESVHTLSGWF